MPYLEEKNQLPEFACDEVTGASSSNLCKQASQNEVVIDSPSLQLVQSQSSDRALARRVLPDIVQCGRIVYRFINKVSLEYPFALSG